MTKILFGQEDEMPEQPQQHCQNCQHWQNEVPNRGFCPQMDRETVFYYSCDEFELREKQEI